MPPRLCRLGRLAEQPVTRGDLRHDRFFGPLLFSQQNEQLQRPARLIAQTTHPGLLHPDGQIIRGDSSGFLNVLDRLDLIVLLQCDRGQRRMSVGFVGINHEHALKRAPRLGQSAPLQKDLPFVQRVLGVDRIEPARTLKMIQRIVETTRDRGDLACALIQARRHGWIDLIRDKLRGLAVLLVGLDDCLGRSSWIRFCYGLHCRRQQDLAQQLMRSVLLWCSFDELAQNKLSFEDLLLDEILLSRR